MSTPPLEQGQLSAALEGQYRVDREIGRGGMGMVFLARDLRLDRAVAIKTLPAHLARDPAVRDRFLREARTAAALSHPNIVPIHAAAEVEDLVYFVMGFVEGKSVADAVRAGPLGAQHAVAILSDVAAALGYAHSKGVVHRDIKAENILLDRREDRAMVTDFGIARVAELSALTATGQVLGTVHYMSPEQVAGERLDGRSDLYSMGVLAFFMLSGRFPFESEVPSAVLVAHVTRQAPRLRTLAPDTPAELAAIVDRLLHKSPGDRFASAQEVGAALARLPAIDPEASTARPAALSSAEAGAVWARAAMLQQMTGESEPPAAMPPILAVVASDQARETAGYELEDVRDAASEAGIDRKYVDRALAERVSASGESGIVQEGPLMREPPSGFLGARTRLEYTATVDGDPLETSIEEVADEIRRAVGEIGSAMAVGRTVTFTADMGSSGDGRPARRLQVTVTGRGGRTTIRALEDLRPLANSVVWGITGGVGGGVGGAVFGVIMRATEGAALLAAPVGLGIAAASYLGSRFWLRAVVRRRERKLRRIVTQLAAALGEMESGGRLTGQRTGPRLPP